MIATCAVMSRVPRHSNGFRMTAKCAGLPMTVTAAVISRILRRTNGIRWETNAGNHESSRR